MDLLKAAAPLLLVLFGVIGVGIVTEDRTATELDDVHERQRRALRFVGLALFVGTCITITVFASPKLGPRFYMHSMALLLAGVFGIIATFLHRPKAFAPFVILAVIGSTFAAAQTIPLYTRLSHESDRRLADLAATPVRGIYTAPSWEPINQSWWALGDDVRDQKKQEMVARYFGLDRVLFRGDDEQTALGLSDVKLTMHYDFDKSTCIDEVDALDVKPFLGGDVGAIHRAFLIAIAEIHRVTGAQMRHVDLVATFLGSQPPLPRKTIYVARWNAGVLEGYTAELRGGQLVLSPALAKSELEIYVVAIGDEPRRLGVSSSNTPLTYEPWRSGEYWVTACKPDYCFVVLTANHEI